jgi:integrase
MWETSGFTMTLSELLLRWLNDYAEERVAGRTLQRYEGIIRNHLIPAFGDVALEDLQPAAIQAYYRRTQRCGRLKGGALSPATVLQHHSVLRSALARAVRWGLHDANPADRADPPRVAAHWIRVLDERETKALLRALHGRSVYGPTLVAVGTGMRRGEILALRWSEIDLKGAVVAVVRSLEQSRRGLTFKLPKTRRSRRQIVLPSFVVRGLKEQRLRQQATRQSDGATPGELGLVFPRADGRAWPPDSFSAEFARQLRLAGQPRIRFHDLRHTHASHLLRQGVHPKVVSERLGHASVGITLDTYSHLLPGMQAEAAEKIDQVLGGGL